MKGTIPVEVSALFLTVLFLGRMWERSVSYTHLTLPTN
jgi:hypothetical protein